MGVCKDPRLTFLNESGYNVIRLPRKGIVPLGVIGRDDKSKTWLGTLDQIWTSDVAVPAAGAPQPVSNLQGTKTSDIKLSLGLEILSNALNGLFGGTAPSVDFAFQSAKSAQFVFREVRSISIDPFVIGNFLAQGDLASSNPFVRRFFTGQKKTEALVVTEVLEAKSIGIIAKKNSNTEVGVDVPQIQAAVGAKLNVTAANSSNSEVTFEGPDHVVFGYKCFGIGMADGVWQVYGVEASAGLAFATDTTAAEPLVESGELVDLDFDVEAAAGASGARG